MRTPAGNECDYFYGDYYRGRSHEECRLLNSALPSIAWKPELCFTCPVPEILLANSCKSMILEPRVERTFPFLKRQVKVNTYCKKNNRSNFDPFIGCGECHPLPPEIFGELS